MILVPVSHNVLAAGSRFDWFFFAWPWNDTFVLRLITRLAGALRYALRGCNSFCYRASKDTISGAMACKSARRQFKLRLLHGLGCSCSTTPCRFCALYSHAPHCSPIWWLIAQSRTCAHLFVAGARSSLFGKCRSPRERVWQSGNHLFVLPCILCAERSRHTSGISGQHALLPCAASPFWNSTITITTITATALRTI